MKCTPRSEIRNCSSVGRRVRRASDDHFGGDRRTGHKQGQPQALPGAIVGDHQDGDPSGDDRGQLHPFSQVKALLSPVFIFLSPLCERLSPLVSVSLPALGFGLASMTLPATLRFAQPLEVRFGLPMLLTDRLPGAILLAATSTNATAVLPQLDFFLAQPANFGLPGKRFAVGRCLFWRARLARSRNKSPHRFGISSATGLRRSVPDTGLLLLRLLDARSPDAPRTRSPPEVCLPLHDWLGQSTSQR